MPLPKRKHSKTRRDKSRTHQKLSLPNMTRCANCQRLISCHTVCPYCGFYKGQEAVKIKIKEKKEKK
jgi:large subunit ribosomal protein L32